MTTATTPQQQYPQEHIRFVLSEIPSRLEALHFTNGGATTPTGAPNRHSPNEPTPATIFANPHPVDNATNVPHSHDNILVPIPSPDEMIIRQRGRRRFNNAPSPDTGNTPLRMPFQRTPTKVPLSTSMILRSSPRKRLTMGSTPPAPEPPIMPSPTKAKQKLWPPGTPLVKKLRLESEDGVCNKPIAQINGETPLPVLLQGMSQQQLIELIVDELVAGDPKTEERLRIRLPMPDIDPLEEELLHAKRQIFRSLPTSRLCKKTDSSAYSRAALHLSEFKRLLSGHTKQLYDSGNWDALLDYVTVAWPIVRATPHWDSAAHNVMRRQCFKLLACHCIAALKNGGLRLGTMRLHETERNLVEWARDYEDVQSCQSTLSKVISKGRVTL
ncbi:uncharacterized protein LOC129242534 [Anastrepha obliqua]|uniref:uncharacterized protein LOC129242534 n=1 Tax=Anastrepha obliqua TaxID=95512 RepID=UPI00240A1456|nr:uncharacterized protein LOC129242534 [Anastrepha obliqua]XP_054735197.1 uncharacterized protein LOC129242534 [Anastrepha obliqua]